MFLGLSGQRAAVGVLELDNEWLVMVVSPARGNPGHAGCGAVILDENGKVVKGLSCYLRYVTNNVAEYEGLLTGLETLLQVGKKRICPE